MIEGYFTMLIVPDSVGDPDGFLMPPDGRSIPRTCSGSGPEGGAFHDPNLLKALFLNLTQAHTIEELEQAHRFGSQFVERLTDEQILDYEDTYQQCRRDFEKEMR